MSLPLGPYVPDSDPVPVPVCLEPDELLDVGTDWDNEDDWDDFPEDGE